LVDPGLLQRTVGGHTTATVRVLERDEPVGVQDFPVDATQTWYLTAPFVVGTLLVLLSYANLESSLKPLRSGHSRRRSYVGAVIWCPVGAVGFLLIGTSLGFAEPTTPQLVVACLLGAAGGVATVRARIGIAKRRRVRKAVKRAEKRLGVHVPTLAPADHDG
jgi:hypothetical protein